MRTCIITLFLAASVLSAPTRQPAAADSDDAKNAIKIVLDEQVRGWNEGNIEKYMAGYVRSDSLRFASGGNVSYGWQAAFDRYKKRYPDKAAMGALEFSDLDIRLICDEAALVFGKWKLRREKDEPWGLFTLLLRKTGDGWRIVHDHTSSAED